MFLKVIICLIALLTKKSKLAIPLYEVYIFVLAEIAKRIKETHFCSGIWRTKAQSVVGWFKKNPKWYICGNAQTRTIPARELFSLFAAYI